MKWWNNTVESVNKFQVSFFTKTGKIHNSQKYWSGNGVCEKSEWISVQIL